MSLIEDIDRDVANVGANGGLDVNIQDQHSATFMVDLNKVNNTTSLTVTAAVGDTSITVADTTGYVDGSFITVTNVAANRYTVLTQIGAPVGSVVSLDTPLDYAYPSGSVTTTGTDGLDVDGSATTQVFSLRAADPGLPGVLDITRIILTCITADVVDLSKFGDIVGGLTKGIVLRKKGRDGIYFNIFNAKTNRDIAGLMYDWTPHAATNPQQGANGFVARFTFSGQSKLGVTIRVREGEDLQLLIQDNLTALTAFKITTQGHVVVD